MKLKLLLLVPAILLSPALSGHRAHAQNYPWCAYGSSGGTNCGFVSFQQCLTTLSGIGGFCNRNTQYIPGAPGDFNPWSRKAGR